MSTDDQFTDEDHEQDHERALRARRRADAATTGTRPDSDWSHSAAGYITLGVVFAVVGTVIGIFLHGSAQGTWAWWWLGAIACLAWGIRLARKG